MTGDPFLVALAALLQWLPHLVFALYAGALADRLDRRLIVVTVDLVRAGVLMLLTGAIVTFNITFGAAWSVLVLYATQHLDLGEIGFGLVTTVSAVGGLIGTLSYGWITVRQRAVPSELQGRVGSVNTVGVFGGLVIGSAIGGGLAQQWGVTAPFWFAFVGSANFLVLIWGRLAHIAHADQ